MMTVYNHMEVEDGAEPYIVVSMTSDIQEGTIYTDIHKHEKYGELMMLAENISQLDPLWDTLDNTQELHATLAVLKKFNEKYQEVADVYNALVPEAGFDKYTSLEYAFWTVVDMAMGCEEEAE